VDPETDKISLIENEIVRLKIREHPNFAAGREKLPPYARQIFDTLLEEEVTPELIELCQEAPDEEWQQVFFMGVLGGGNPNPYVARMLTNLVLRDMLYLIEKSN
jgi:hypothetical protein